MKKTLLALFALALTATAASAQTTTAPGAATKTTGTDANQTAHHEEMMKMDGRGASHHGHGKNHGHKSPAQHAAKMAKELGLTADQQAKVQGIFLAQNQEMETLKAKYAANANHQAMRPEAEAIHAKYDGQLKTALGADAYARYDKMRDEHREENKKGHQMKADRMKAKIKS